MMMSGFPRPGRRRAQDQAEDRSTQAAKDTDIEAAIASLFAMSDQLEETARQIRDYAQGQQRKRRDAGDQPTA